MSIIYPGVDSWVQIEQNVVAPSWPGTPVLDTGTRADENPLSFGGKWAGGVYPLALVGGKFTDPTPGFPQASSYWVEEFSANQEVFCTATGPFTGIWLIDLSVRQSGIPGQNFGYDCWWSDGDYGIEKVTPSGGFVTLLDNVAPSTLVAGDVLCFRVEGNVLTMLVNGVVLASIVDNDVRDSGKIALDLTNTTADNFGGGATGPAWIQLQQNVAAPALPALTVLDNFNRADENPLSGGGNWASMGVSRPRLVSNQIAGAIGAGGGVSASSWTPPMPGPNVEAHIEVPVVDSWIGIYARFNADTGEGYSVFHNPADGDWAMWETSIFIAVTNGPALANGDAFGIRCLGSTIQALARIAGTWIVVLSATDTVNDGTGSYNKLAIEIDGATSTTRLDNFTTGPVDLAWMEVER